MNFTTPSDQETVFVFKFNIWITNLVFHVLLTFVSLYLISALIYHEVKVEKKRDHFFDLSTEKKYAILSKGICIFISFMSLLRNLNSVGFLWMEISAVSRNSSFDSSLILACRVLPKSGNVILTAGVGFVYLFLWFRQRVFYIHPSLKVLNNLTTRIMSSAVALVWLTCFLSLLIAYFIVVHYDLVLGGGCLVKSTSILSYLGIILSWGAVSLIIQIALLLLFIYPIMKKMSWTSAAATRNSVLLKRVKKAVFLTVTCMISDILSAILPPAFFKENENDLFFFYSINLTVNHMVTIACFDHWKKLIWPWKSDKSMVDKKNSLTENPVTFNESTQQHPESTTTMTLAPNSCNSSTENPMMNNPMIIN